MRGRYVVGGIAISVFVLIATSERLSKEVHGGGDSSASETTAKVASSVDESMGPPGRRPPDIGEQSYPPHRAVAKHEAITQESVGTFEGAPTSASANNVDGGSAAKAGSPENEARPKITIREMYDQVCQTEYGNPYCYVALPLIEKATDSQLTAARDEWATSMESVLAHWAAQYVQNGAVPGVDVGCTPTMCAIHLHGSFEAVSKSGVLSDEGFTKDLRKQQWYSEFKQVFEGRTPKEQTPFWPASRNGIGLRMTAPLRFTCAIGDGPCGAIVLLERS
jgi:hypothetical protein